MVSITRRFGQTESVAEKSDDSATNILSIRPQNKKKNKNVTEFSNVIQGDFPIPRICQTFIRFYYYNSWIPYTNSVNFPRRKVQFQW